MIKKNRKPNRLRNHVYLQPGYYFVTICTRNKQQLFGKIIDRQMVTNDAGKMVERTWNELPEFYRGVQIDQFQIMPNHVHGIIVIVGNDPRINPVGIGPRACPNTSAPRACPNTGQPQGVVPTMSLPDIMHRFKSFTTHKYMAGVKNDGWKSFDGKLWQRSFYDHVIRNEKSLDNIRAYIQNNPLKWELDAHNPRNYISACRPAVKLAIEQDEQTAMGWLENETRSI